MKLCECDSLAKIGLSSIDKKLCADCLGYTDWKLKPNQTSTLIRGKHGNKAVLGVKNKRA